MQISSNLHSNVSRSTRINSSSVHTYIFVCFTLRVILQGFVTQNATWCQKWENVSRSTRINSSSVHTYIFVCFTLRVILQGFVTQNATWCQNRGCICISSTRRTYGRIHSSFLHPAYIRTIIL